VSVGTRARAGYKINAGCKEVEDARRILTVHERLASEVEYSTILDLLSTLQGFSGSAILNRTEYQLECIRKIESETEVESLEVLLDIVAHIKGHGGLDRMRHVRMLERQLPSQKSIPELSEMLEQCSVLTKTTSMVAAEGILYAENALHKGESDFDTIVEHLKVCDGMFGSPALERARRAVAAEEALRSCASDSSSHHVKELLRDCEFVTGSQVINQAKRRARLHQELQGWVPFCLIRSLAQKIGQGFDTGAEQGAQNSTGIHTKSCKQRVQDLFAEFDTDKSGYIDREEMQTAFDRMGVRLTEREVDNLMSMADEDGTGEIDVLEFSDLIDSMLAKLNSIHSEDDEIQKIASIMEELEGVHEASSHADDAQAIHEARFKIQMHSLENETHADTIRNFFSEYQDMLTSYTFLPEHVIERQGWVDSEDRIRSLLKSKSTGTPVVIAKRELWEAVQNCGALSGSLVLTRARRILDAENKLLFETNVHQLITLLKICGVLHGSPAVLNAKRLVSAEAALAALMDGTACCTMHEIQSAVNLCDNLQGSVVIDKAKSVILCEAVLESETRSPIIRCILALCECVRDSRIIDRCRSTIATEWSIAVHEPSSELTSLDDPIEFMMTEVMRQSLEVAKAESLKLLRALASNVQVPVLRLSYEIVNVDTLWEVMQKCDGITESPVLDHAALILLALDALPWTLDLEGMNMIKRAIIKEMGGHYMERHRMQAKLMLIFERMDGDGSGILSKHELDKAFFELGVNMLPADIDFLFQKYDTDNSGAVNFEEFENMTYDLLRGNKWTNSTNSSDIRQHLQVCGHMRSGMLSDRVTSTSAWIAAEDQLIEGIASHKLLIDTVERCGALTGSDILEKSVAILQAADEIKYATHAADIQALINICGHLDGPEHMIERKRWLVAEERLYTLNYDKPFTEWLPCPYADLCDMVEQCGGLEESTALVNATKVLKAEAQLSLVKDVPTLRSLLKVCGHLTGSSSIASRRKALKAYSSLLGTRDVVRLQQLLKDCSSFEPCYLIRSIEELLNREAQMKNCFSEENLRVGISILSAKISGSKNLSVALRRYGKFQR
jgi:Ca2+-binding EF-hand superfamily protein